MEFQVGDKVSFLNEKLDGVVAKIISKDQVAVTIEEGFDIPVLNRELVLVERKSNLEKKVEKLIQREENKKVEVKKIDPTSIQNESDEDIFKPLTIEKVKDKEREVVMGREEIRKVLQEKMQTKVVGKISLKHSHRRPELEVEVDLHIEQLLDHWKHMSNTEIVLHQISVARERLDQAILDRMHRIVFIHGVGNGTLKKEVLKLVQSYPGTRTEDGHFGVYGVGATVVHL